MARRPYDSQYEDSYDPWPDTVFKWIIYLIFFAPGSFLLWVAYMWPKSGDVWASKRRAENKLMQFLYSILFWLVSPFAAIYFLLFFLAVTHPPDRAQQIRALEYHPYQNPLRKEEPAQAVREPQNTFNQDTSDLSNIIVNSYRECRIRAGFQLPPHYIPVIRIFFSEQGNIDDLTIPNVPSNDRWRESAFALLQIIKDCQVNIPENLKYLAARWGQKNIRFTP